MIKIQTVLLIYSLPAPSSPAVDGSTNIVIFSSFKVSAISISWYMHSSLFTTERRVRTVLPGHSVWIILRNSGRSTVANGWREVIT